MGIFEKFKIGLNKSALSISGGIKNLVLKKKIDEETLNNLEEFLIQNDVGVEVANEIKNVISEKKISLRRATFSVTDSISDFPKFNGKRAHPEFLLRLPPAERRRKICNFTCTVLGRTRDHNYRDVAIATEKRLLSLPFNFLYQSPPRMGDLKQKGPLVPSRSNSPRSLLHQLPAMNFPARGVELGTTNSPLPVGR